MKKAEFSPIRSLLWPIHNKELKKFLPMAGMIFLILFNYTILRNMKDTLVVNAAGAGAITFLKLYCVTPAAILFVVMYIKVSSIVSKENIFYVMLAPFLAFFLVFGFVIYPNADIMHPSIESITALKMQFPSLTGFIDIYAYWSFSLFFILAEIWGSVGVSLLFWQFANQVVKMEDSKRFYALFISIGNISLIVCGFVASVLATGVQSIIPKGMDKWTFSLTVQMALVAIAGVSAMGLFRFLHVKVLPFEEKVEKVEKKKKSKPGLMDSIKTVFSSKHLMLIAALVITYGISINLVEVQWKNQVKILYAGDKIMFNKFMNSYSMWTGVISIAFGWVAGSGILKRLSWLISASITPVIVLIGGGILFATLFLADVFKNAAMNPVYIAAMVGAAVVAVSKTVKYALFDPTKEMAYIPLDDDLKSKGKAAVDVVGGRMGKAGGAFAQSFILMAIGTSNIILIAPYAVVIFAVVCVLWVYSVRSLSKEVKKALHKQAK